MTISNEAKELSPSSYFVGLLRDSLSLRMVGFLLTKSWVYTLFLAPTTVLLVDGISAPLSFNSLSRIALIVTLLLGALIPQVHLDRISAKIKCITASGCMAVGTLLLCLPSLPSNVLAVIAVVASLLTGFGSGVFTHLWGCAYARIGGKQAAAEASFAFALAMLIVPLFLLLPGILQIVALIVFPLGSACLFLRDQVASPQDSRSSMTREVPKKTFEQTYAKSYLLKIALSSVVFGAVITLFRFIYSAYGSESEMDSALLLAVSAVCAAVFVLCSLAFSRYGKMALTYRPVLFFLALGCFLIPLLEQSPLIPYFFARTGYVCFLILNWSILTTIASRSSLSPYCIFGIGQAAVSIGMMIGSDFPLYAGNMGISLVDQPQAVSGILVFALLITYLLTIPSKVKSNSKSANHPSSQPLGLEEKCDTISCRYELGERASEVLLLYAKGRSKTRISQELYISESTVNFHIRTIYQKLGIHSRQELLDFIESNNKTT